EWTASGRALSARRAGRGPSDLSLDDGLPRPGRLRQAIRDLVALAKPGGVDQHLPGPPVDVELGDVQAHGAHALLLLLRGHLQGRRERRAALLEVVGVDYESLGQLARRAGEAAQDQNAPLVVAGREEL